MITLNATTWEPRVWREELAQAYRSPTALLQDLDLPAETITDNPFPTLVPRPFVSRMQKGNRRDPLLLQVLPVDSELKEVAGFTTDPLAEIAASRAPGLIHKYSGRALLITTPGCAVHCRYCFRRHFPYTDHQPADLAPALSTLQADTSIHEVILSGGDPLLLTDSRLSTLLDELEAIDHIARIRIHTRLPVVLPQRVTEGFLNRLHRRRKEIVIVVHCNHPRELDPDTHRAMSLIRSSGVWLLNQAVLLREVNDNVEVQVELVERLFDQGVLPYYLHLPDPIAGTHHFYVDEPTGVALHHALLARLSGYLVPRLVKEVAGEANKRLISG